MGKYIVHVMAINCEIIPDFRNEFIIEYFIIFRYNLRSNTHSGK